MGYYTDIDIDLVLSPETPIEVLTSIQHMGRFEGWLDCGFICGPVSERCNYGGLERPTIAFHQTDRNDHFLSYGPVDKRLFEKTEKGWHLKVQGMSMKAYDDIVPKFVDYVRPHCLPQEEPIVETEGEAGERARYFAEGLSEWLEGEDYCTSYGYEQQAPVWKKIQRRT